MTEIPLNEIDDDLIEQVIEDILESIFGTSSKMSRALFLQKLVSKECKWIMDSEEIRKRIKRYIKARQQGVSVMDQMSHESHAPVSVQEVEDKTFSPNRSFQGSLKGSVQSEYEIGKPGN